MDLVDFFWNQIDKQLNVQNTNYEWLYKATKISKGTFSSWKTNRRLPRIDKAYSIAQCLGVSSDWLISGQEKNPLLIKYSDILADLEEMDLGTLDDARVMISSLAEKCRKKDNSVQTA